MDRQTVWICGLAAMLIHLTATVQCPMRGAQQWCRASTAKRWRTNNHLGPIVVTMTGLPGAANPDEYAPTIATVNRAAQAMLSEFQCNCSQRPEKAECAAFPDSTRRLEPTKNVAGIKRSDRRH